MKFFIDSADIEAIEKFTKSGMVDGVTTNPSIIAKSGKDFKDVIKEICSITPGPVSAEVTATNAEGMIEEGLVLSKIAKNVAIKVPLTWAGLEACKTLSDKDIMINVTLCFSATQALLAAKAGATFISPFIGRLDDIGADGMNLISEITEIYDIHGFETKVLAASIRSVQDIIDSAKLGADVATIPPKFLKAMQIRFEKYPQRQNKDLESFSEVNRLKNKWIEKVVEFVEEDSLIPEAFIDFQWDLQELRVSLFAQELKTTYPISIKRLNNKWTKLLDL